MVKPETKKRLDYIDLLRVVFCLSVLFYHLGVMKGGFLSVCGFFVLSGYFITASLDKEDLNVFSYYKKRIKQLYLPLAVIVLSVILLCSVLDVFWVTLKPETTSILAGYNNYYQISVNNDYFARTEDSPFTHLWYISILIQFEIIYPLIFLLVKRINRNKKRVDPLILTLLILVAGIIYFYVSYSVNNISIAYYGSVERIYSFAFGIFAYYLKKNGSSGGNIKIKKAAFAVILLFMCAGMYIFDSSDLLMPELMILYSLLTMTEVLLAAGIGETGCAIFKAIRTVSSMTYEIYLIHYPLMVIMNRAWYSNPPKDLQFMGVLFFSLAAAFVFHTLFGVSSKSNPLIILACCVLGFVTIYGGCLYVLEKDHTEEMKALEEQLTQEEQNIHDRQEEYLARLSEENMKWDELMLSYGDEDYAEKAASAVRVCGIGDSVLLGASPYLYSAFDNFYCDAVVSRPGLYVRDIMAAMKRNGILQEAVLVHIGSNGGLWAPQMNDIVNFVNANNLQLFWVTVTNDRSYSVYCNSGIRERCAGYDNIHLIDWEVLSAGHSDWFVGDGIHVNGYGGPKYAKFVYDAIHGYYVEKFEEERQKVLSEIEEAESRRYSFYGGDMLANLNKGLSELYPESTFRLLQNKEAGEIIKLLSEDAENRTLAKNVVILTDHSFALNESDIPKLRRIMEGKNLLIVSMSGNDQFLVEGAEYLSVKDELEDFRHYLHSDRLHLNEEGVKTVLELIRSRL